MKNWRSKANLKNQRSQKGATKAKDPAKTTSILTILKVLDKVYP
jgi:hypothetical protein